MVNLLFNRMGSYQLSVIRVDNQAFADGIGYLDAKNIGFVRNFKKSDFLRLFTCRNQEQRVILSTAKDLTFAPMFLVITDPSLCSGGHVALGFNN